MQIAQMDYSKQLFDLTNWGADCLAGFTRTFHDDEDEARQRPIPLYDAEYLQAKSKAVIIDPAPLDDPWTLELTVTNGAVWAILTRLVTNIKYAKSGDDLREALLRLCISLAHKGVITKEENEHGQR